MLRRHAVAIALGIALVAPVGSYAQNAAPRHQPRGINARERRQIARIKDGVKDKELTKGELDKLKADEAAIRAKERVYRQSGNGLNRSERRDLESDLNKTSREIHRAKHNNRQPGN
jgi:hypothetical protein